jgi:hypothetical protein
VAELGIGAAHDGPTPSIESLSDALRTALVSETRIRATAVAGTIRTDGATVAARLLLDAGSQEKAPSVRVNHTGPSRQEARPARGISSRARDPTARLGPTRSVAHHDAISLLQSRSLGRLVRLAIGHGDFRARRNPAAGIVVNALSMGRLSPGLNLAPRRNHGARDERQIHARAYACSERALSSDSRDTRTGRALLEPLDRSPGPLLVSAASGSLVESAPTATKQKPIGLLNFGRSQRRCFLRTRRDARETGDARR